MRSRLARLACLFGLLVCVPLLAWAQGDDTVPKLSAYVTDQTGTLDAAQTQALETRLRALDQSTGSQVVILMVPALGDADLEQFSLAVAEANVVGRKKVNDGILVLVAKDDHKARVEVGYGLEGAVPDITGGRIIREYMAPKFRNGDYAGGLNDAVTVLEGAIRGEQLPQPMSGQGQGDGGGENWLLALFVAFMVAQVARGIFGRLPAGVRGLLGGGASGAAAWLLSSALLVGGLGGVIGLLVGLMAGGGGGRFARHGGSGGFGGGPWIGGGSSGGGWGGSSGGGFSGGGGSFGGGGASGSW